MADVAEPFNLSLKQAAALADVSDRTVRRYVQDGKLAAHRLPNGYLRFRRSDIERTFQYWRTSA